MLDKSALLIGAPKPASPAIVENQQTHEKTAYPRVAVEMVSHGVLQMLVDTISRNVTQNVVVNMCARLKDRCAHEKTNGDLCNIARAAHHVNDHDFTEKPAEPHS